MTLKDTVRLAIEVLGHDQGDDEMVSRKLSEAAGISINCASTLITFVPLAIARVWLSGSPLCFPPSYAVSDASGQPVKRRYFEANSAFQEAHRQGQRLINAKYPTEKLLAIAARSPEFQAVNAALHDGAHIENLELTEPIVAYDDLDLSPIS
jgi:hypothetical protein